MLPVIPTRNYNRAILLPERYSKEKSDLLPKATRKLVQYIMDLTKDGIVRVSIIFTAPYTIYLNFVASHR